MEKVTLNHKEQKRLLVFNEVLAGRMTGQEAADILGITVRHTRRLLARYRREHGQGSPRKRRAPRQRRRRLVQERVPPPQPVPASSLAVDGQARTPAKPSADHPWCRQGHPAYERWRQQQQKE